MYKNKVFMRVSSVLFIAVLLVLHQNCGQFQIAQGYSFTAYNSKSENNPFQCDSFLLPEPNPLKKLSKIEYMNTVSDLFSGALSSADINQIAVIVPRGSEEPLDSTEYVEYKQVKAYLDASNKVLDLVLSSQQKIKDGLNYNCTSETDKQCVSNWIKSFGMRALRRNLTKDEVTEYLYAFQSEASKSEALRLVSMQMLNSPHFLYKVEVSGQSTSDKFMVKLSAYEVASKISYLLTKSMPDNELLKAAEDKSLLNDEVIEAHIDRLMKSERFKHSFQDFTSRWLEYNHHDLGAYSSYTLEGANLSSEVRAAIYKEANNFLDYVVDNDFSYEKLMTSRYADIPHVEVAKLYGLSSTGKVNLPAQERRGILSRIAVLADGHDSTSVIHRAIRVYKDVICSPIPLPEDGVIPTLAVNTSKSQRDIVTEATGGPKCIGCHRIINPMGFAFEQLDTLGRFRSKEKKFDQSGNLIAEFDINSSADLRFDSGIVNVNGVVDMIDAVAREPQSSACFVKKWVQYSTSRKVSKKDNCSMASMFDEVYGADGSIKLMVKKLILSDHFMYRTFSN